MGARPTAKVCVVLRAHGVIEQLISSCGPAVRWLGAAIWGTHHVFCVSGSFSVGHGVRFCVPIRR